MKSALLALLCAASAHAGVSVLAEWDEETGDFGGAPFPLRSEFETFINTDGSGNVVSYGFYIPLLSRLGLDYTDFDPDRPDPPRGAALDFEWQALPNPSQMPYRFVGLNFNPNGHPGEEFLIPHFDIHLWLYGSEFSKGLQCAGTSFAPCNTTDYLEARFALSPPQEYYPTGYINNPAEWVATMGAHLLPNPIPDTFDTIPSAIFGSYNGEIIYHEPMIANTILLDVEANGPKDFAWPSVTTYPNDGRFYTNMNIAVEGQRYRLTFNQLASNPSPIADLFTGSQHTPAEAMSAIPSATKDCFILSGGLYDVGYRVTAPSGSYCCRSRGDYNSVADSCTRSTCTSPTNLANPSDAFFARSDSVFCFARCYAA